MPPAPLSESLAYEFSSTTRKRGRHYVRQGAVSIADGSARAIRAVVLGTFEYTVTMRLTARSLHVSCTCQSYVDLFEPCKHIWATLLEAEAVGLIPPDSRATPIDLLTEEPDPQDVNDTQDDFLGLMGDEAAFGLPSRSRRMRGYDDRPARAGRPSIQSTWTTVREAVRHDLAGNRPVWSRPDLAFSELHFIVDVETCRAVGGLVIELACRTRRSNGEWGKIKAVHVTEGDLRKLPEPDHELLVLLLGARGSSALDAPAYHDPFMPVPGAFRVPDGLQARVIPLLHETGRFHLRPPGDARNERLQSLVWDDGPAWAFWLEVRPAGRTDPGSGLVLSGSFRHEPRVTGVQARQAAAWPDLVVAGGLIFSGSSVGRIDADTVFPWIVQLRRQDPIAIPRGKEDELLRLIAQANPAQVELPPDLRFERVQSPPTPQLALQKAGGYRGGSMDAVLWFEYEGHAVSHDDEDPGIWLAGDRRLLERDTAAEAAALGRLRQLGVRQRPGYLGDEPRLEVTAAQAPRVVSELLAEGWRVVADGQRYRQPSGWHLDVRSGIDWFELHGRAVFDDVSAPLPELLEALAGGTGTVRLSDGTFGVLPAGWLGTYGSLAALGRSDGECVRFERHQVGLLDALLAAEPAATCDETFERMRQALRAFRGVARVEPPPTFAGRLRGYQRDGLGWLEFLQRFGFGGCLADDMGLGKTVMVLALLDAQRHRDPDGGAALRPSLVVVPRSLIFNWIQEARRFTPGLRLLDYTGCDRRSRLDQLPDHDVVLTTYGTLRRDAPTLRELEFDYVVLDEAQAIKNARTASAKAARLLRARHRLALSGTPIENHLGELWSLFEFLNPGLLGSAAVFKRLAAPARRPDDETATVLANAVRPFVLRRTKDQVARDLPAKHEQTVYCDLDAKQRVLYDELREHYRRSLLQKVDRQGLARSKILILEALLRLRQAACHPALLDRKRAAESSAKLEVLLARLDELRQEGRKALVFSQFTRFLALVRGQLDRLGVVYEYLDGRTRDRARPVERFQHDPDVGLFLVSLKAGGLGLNLTAAEYVFLLDPWWNPAVEAQAVDRTHRIGQTRQVFAYRLIARNTVEEKILELQQTKRDLADAILTEANSLIRTIRREDLELLLS